MKLKDLIVVTLLGILGCTSNKINLIPEKGFVSWLPAASWEDALLTGNGTMGAMVYGDPFEETIILNHALLYLPNEAPLLPPNMAPYLGEIRKLSFEGKWKEVAELGVKIWEKEGYGEKKWTDPYVPAADLKITMPPSNVDKYQRMVNFQTAEAIVSWKDENGQFTRKTFVSRADGMMVTQIKGNSLINTNIQIIKHPHSWEQNSFVDPLITNSITKSLNDNTLQYHCEYSKAHIGTPKGYDAIVRVISKGGTIKANENYIEVKSADEVLIFTNIEPFFDFNNANIASLIQQVDTLNADYDILLNRQKKTHGEIYNRMNINLFPSAEEKRMTSETLVLKAKSASSPGIMQRQFEAARYNILCATGTNPPNLQGIWSGSWTPPWSSDFTHDGNVEVAISNLLNGNMAELMMAYFDYHERLLPQYRINAKQFYGARGIHIPSHTSTHGFNNHYDETWCLEYWNGAAGWTASSFYDFFLYTGDTAFLRNRAFPFITEALEFWEDFLVIGDDGKYIVAPSYSPENNPLEHRWQNCINATMDIVIIKQLLQNWIAAAKLLGVDDSTISKKTEMLKKLPLYQISNEGVIKEWIWPGFTDNQSHRHASHLYGLYEIPDEDIMNSPELLNAAKQTIIERMKIRKQQHGGEMAFGMCHLGFSAVNVGDSDNAAEILKYLSMYYWTNGMATTHNPGNLFNMDISGGFPSLMTRMLINSRPGFIDVLPAIPSDWMKGDASGIKARGNIEIGKIAWNPESVYLALSSAADQQITIKLNDGLKVVDIEVIGADADVENKQIITLNLIKGKTIEIKWKL